MNYPKVAILGLFFVVAIGWVACGKDERKPEAAGSEQRKSDAAAAEAEKRSGVMAELLTEQQFLDIKIKAAAGRLEKQGNKTRKKLNPRFASLDAERVEVSTRLENLPALPEPGFIEESNRLRARQDSLSRSLSTLEKAMK